MKGIEPPSNDKMQMLRDTAEGFGLKAQIGG